MEKVLNLSTKERNITNNLMKIWNLIGYHRLVRSLSWIYVTNNKQAAAAFDVLADWLAYFLGKMLWGHNTRFGEILTLANGREEIIIQFYSISTLQVGGLAAARGLCACPPYVPC
ncbi:hypothetical protein AVEN_42188-1 [Araneus ventricosus]|uniref:Uncharacterized protein n=1 Tax=Araneus ventricosus TaxID=182803 RepID=A0A4Y2AYR0_ARAVE|nr:hypothetical protein AVEN_42188-1 [Araneus ventricosus]